jgi:hypothetical protein
MNWPPKLYIESFPWHCAEYISTSSGDENQPQYPFGPPMEAYSLRYEEQCGLVEPRSRTLNWVLCARHNIAYSADEEGCGVCLGWIEPLDERNS